MADIEVRPTCTIYASPPLTSARWFDPIFAVSMGFCAAALRIRREGIEKSPGEDNSYATLWKRGTAMSRQYFGHER